MAAKCNITSSILQKLAQLKWGVNSNAIDEVIIENYVEQLACDCIDLDICHPDNCINDTIIVTCNVQVAKISNTIVENLVTFYIQDIDLTGGLAPYTYQWSFEQDDFDNSGTVDVNKAVLTVKLGKKPELLVTKITVTITDNNGCKVTKSCYMTPQGMQCLTTYKPCSTITNLKLISKNVTCVRVKSLVVTKYNPIILPSDDINILVDELILYDDLILND